MQHLFLVNEVYGLTYTDKISLVPLEHRQAMIHSLSVSKYNLVNLYDGSLLLLSFLSPSTDKHASNRHLFIYLTFSLSICCGWFAKSVSVITVGDNQYPA